MAGHKKVPCQTFFWPCFFERLGQPAAGVPADQAKTSNLSIRFWAWWPHGEDTEEGAEGAASDVAPQETRQINGCRVEVFYLCECVILLF